MSLEIIGTLVGLVYLWLEYKASIYLWVASIIMPAIYLNVYYQAGLYADFGINVYYLLASVYGWLVWQYGGRKGNTDDAETVSVPITHLPLRRLPWAALAFAVCFFLIGWILVHFTDSTVPWLDSFTTAMSIVGMWMLARKYMEQWFAWVAVDAVSAGLYVYKGLHFTAALYALYTIIAIFGYFKWKKLMAQQQ